MGKALVIKNADFSSNKVTTVTFNDIYCTGVEFASSEVTLTATGEAEVEYTITPSNTTDEVHISSSDASVVSVSDNVLTVNGIGSCILTLSCGNYTDQCEVTVDIYENPVYYTAYIGSASDGSEHTGVLISGSSKRIVVGKKLSDTDFTEPIPKIAAQNIIPSDPSAPIPIPNNTQKIHIEGMHLYSGTFHYIVFFEDTDETFQNGANTYTTILSKSTLEYTTVGGETLINQDIEVPANAKGFLIGLRQHPNYDSTLDACTMEAEVKTLCEGTFGISIHYLEE